MSVIHVSDMLIVVDDVYVARRSFQEANLVHLIANVNHFKGGAPVTRVYIIYIYNKRETTYSCNYHLNYGVSLTQHHSVFGHYFSFLIVFPA